MANSTNKKGCLLIFTVLPSFLAAAAIRDSKGVLKTIQISNGDTIDCVGIYKQPAFDHPLLKNHEIEIKMESSISEDVVHLRKSSRKYAEIVCEECCSCPEGTIPVLRINNNGTVYPDDTRTELAMAWIGENDVYYNAVSADISVWKPYVPSGHFSSAHVGVQNEEGSSVINAGWEVNPTFFGDLEPRSFISLQVKVGREIKSCTNLACPGFVLVPSTGFVLGGQLWSSSIGGPLSIINVRILKSSSEGRWYVEFNNVKVGYWTFDTLHNFTTAKRVSWVGRVSNNSSGSGASTHMGNGHFGDEGFRRAAHFAEMEYLDQIDHRRSFAPGILHIDMTLPQCYNMVKFRHSGDESLILFGGPEGEHCY